MFRYFLFLTENKHLSPHHSATQINYFRTVIFVYFFFLKVQSLNQFCSALYSTNVNATIAFTHSICAVKKTGHEKNAYSATNIQNIQYLFKRTIIYWIEKGGQRETSVVGLPV